MRRAISEFILLLFLAGTARAQFHAIAPEATADGVLDAMQARGQEMRDFSAAVTVTAVDQATMDTSSQGGRVLFQKLPGDQGRLRVDFDQRTEGDRIIQEKRQYTLADGWLVERDYDKKTEIRRQVVRPGEKIDLLKLGEGPFPLPVGQKKEDVYKQFDVTLAAPDKTDPSGTAHLKLTPKPSTDLARRFTQIDVWVDRQLGMPLRIVTLDNAGQQSVTTDLTGIRLNGGLKDDDFALEKVAGWDTTEEPFGQ